MEDYLDSKEHYLLYSDDEKFGLGDEFLEPFKYLNGYEGRLSMVGACNGLICLGDPCFMDGPHIFVGNPSIWKLVALPIPSKPPRLQHAVVFGFGAHPTTHEYKVIRILYLMRNGYVFQIPPKTEVYTQGAASWRDITSGHPPQGLLTFAFASPQAFVIGAIHWTRDRYNSIVSFDIGVEEFSEMMLPPTLTKKISVCVSIKAYKESHAVLCCERMCGGPYSIWVMKEYGVAESWTLLFNNDTSSV